MRISTPIFSENESNKNKCISIRCTVEKNVWTSFKTLISLRGLDIKEVLSKIIRNWVVNFGKSDIVGEYLCSNCGEVIDNDNCIIIVKDSFKLYYCRDCEIGDDSHGMHFWYR